MPEVLCIVSSLGSWQFYESLLKTLEQKRKESLDRATELMQAAYGKPLPRPGMEAWIRSMVGPQTCGKTVGQFRGFVH